MVAGDCQGQRTTLTVGISTFYSFPHDTHGNARRWSPSLGCHHTQSPQSSSIRPRISPPAHSTTSPTSIPVQNSPSPNHMNRSKKPLSTTNHPKTMHTTCKLQDAQATWVAIICCPTLRCALASTLRPCAGGLLQTSHARPKEKQ